MYNYFKHEKLLKEEEKELEKQKIEAQNLLFKTKHKTKELVEKYEDRVKQFIYIMAGKNYEISNNSKLILNTRQEFQLEKNKDNKSKTKFNFNHYETERERIEKLNKKKKEIEDYYQKGLPKKRREIIKEDSISFIKYAHEKRKKMLENNGIHYKGIDFDDPYLTYKKGIVEVKKQLKLRNEKQENESKLLGKTHFKAVAGISLNRTLYDNDLIKKLKQAQKIKDEEGNGKKNSLMNNTISTSKINEHLLKHSNCISEVKIADQKILSNYKSKLSNVKSKYLDDPDTVKEQSLILDSSSVHRRRLSGSTKKANQYPVRKFSLKEENFDLIQGNPLLYDVDINPLKRSEEESAFNKEQFDRLKNLAFNENNKNLLGSELKGAAQGKKVSNFLKKIKSKNKRGAIQVFKRNPINFFKNYNINLDIEDGSNKKISDDGKIWVEGVLMDKSDIVNLSKRILKKTNFINEKDHRVQFTHIGEGKLSFTNGLSVDSFRKTYNVK